MQRVITSCVTGPLQKLLCFSLLGIASWRYIFSYQDGILQSENSKWCSKEKKKKMLSDLRSLQPPRFTRKRSCPSEFIINISSNVNVE
ncbi:HN1_G0027890.mRNA.1.CDS.1 [Saccharomyces cerevisiae]|nr:HN1_G0027890.mRNA.1.CDS.1 [Saccharomyces cerevisiae]CAI4604532.1 BAL_1a_G0035610.mRNA.1.CDS.1 [Saccharomyces cerevisiae]CAI7227770.1 BAL_1a_G0035610.mRNA.1.CDS.1 [Saccharomyces cerevisiae]